jgi:hypothetical protein
VKTAAIRVPPELRNIADEVLADGTLSGSAAAHASNRYVMAATVLCKLKHRLKNARKKATIAAR